MSFCFGVVKSLHYSYMGIRFHDDAVSVFIVEVYEPCFRCEHSALSLSLCVHCASQALLFSCCFGYSVVLNDLLCTRRTRRCESE